MTDPAYLLDSSADEFERALLGAAERDVGSQAAKARCMAAISPAAALIATSQSSNAAALLSVLKGLGLGIVLGTAASGAAIVGTSEHSSRTPFGPSGKGATAVPRAVAHATSAPVEPNTHSARPAATQAQPSELGTRTLSPGTRVNPASDLGAKAQSPIAPASTPPFANDLDSHMPGAAPSHVAPRDRSLELEVRALDQVRGELAAGNARRALETLARYQRDFPRGALLPEGVLLNVQALIAAGQRTEAGVLGRRFLANRSAGADVRKLSRLLEQEQLR